MSECCQLCEPAVHLRQPVRQRRLHAPAGALADLAELQCLADLGKGQPERLGPTDEPEPLHQLRRVEPVARAGPWRRRNQALALVVVKGLDAHAEICGGLSGSKIVRSVPPPLRHLPPPSFQVRIDALTLRSGPCRCPIRAAVRTQMVVARLMRDPPPVLRQHARQPDEVAGHADQHDAARGLCRTAVALHPRDQSTVERPADGG
jgi:hypothetical protein